MPLKNKNLDRVRAEQRGRRGETLAGLWLQVHGYRVIGRRVRTPFGEIDLVARRGGVVVFCEVKQRCGKSDLEPALLAVNQQRISRAADYFIARRPALAQKSIRFDVIFLAPLAWPLHLRGAFEQASQGGNRPWR